MPVVVPHDIFEHERVRAVAIHVRRGAAIACEIQSQVRRAACIRDVHGLGEQHADLDALAVLVQAVGHARGNVNHRGHRVGTRPVDDRPSIPYVLIRYGLRRMPQDRWRRRHALHPSLWLYGKCATCSQCVNRIEPPPWRRWVICVASACTMESSFAVTHAKRQSRVGCKAAQVLCPQQRIHPRDRNCIVGEDAVLVFRAGMHASGAGLADHIVP